MDTNSHGRLFRHGKVTSDDLSLLIIGDIKDNGGDEITGIVPRGVTQRIADKYKMSRWGTKKIWNRYIKTGSCRRNVCEPVGRPSKLLENDVAFLEGMKTSNPTMTSKHMNEQLKIVSASEVSDRTIQRAIQHRFTGGPWTYKRTVRAATRRFTLENLRYTQAYLDVLHTINPRRLKFMDESGFKLMDVANANYGHSLRGQRCVDVIRYHPSPNTTLNLLTSTDGIVHAQVIDGASNSVTFSEFVHQCVDTVTEHGVPALQPGDFLVLDNAPIHHSQIARALNIWLNLQGIEVIFTPTYSPEFNPAEFCFGKIKKILERPPFCGMAYDNLAYAIYTAVEEITAADTRAFYNATGYLFV